MTHFWKALIATFGLLLAAVYCFLGVLQNGSFAVAGSSDSERFHRHAQIWFALFLIAIGLAVILAVLAFRVRRLARLRLREPPAR